MPDGAFTYPHGRLSTFELAYGPRGWFVNYPFSSSNVTAIKFLQTTTSQVPAVKWNSTWLYTRRSRTRMFTTTTTTTIPITTTTTIPQTTIIGKYIRSELSVFSDGKVFTSRINDCGDISKYFNDHNYRTSYCYFVNYNDKSNCY
jgi:hypothetical protein